MSDELILLKDICAEYLGLSERRAVERANMGLLPIPAFRLSGTRKGPMFVRRADIDALIQSQADKYAKLHSKMQGAGLV